MFGFKVSACNFNSTLVQLIDVRNDLSSLCYCYFNSTLVQLIVIVGFVRILILSHFNSTLVQLIVPSCFGEFSLYYVFQFYFSSINR